MSLNFQHPPPGLSRPPPPDPLCNPTRLLLPVCVIPYEPPSLLVFLNSRIARVSMAFLEGDTRYCIICERPMCDYSIATKRQAEAAAKTAEAARERMIRRAHMPALVPRVLKMQMIMPYKTMCMREPPGGICEQVLEHTCEDDRQGRRWCKVPIRTHADSVWSSHRY